MIILTILLSLLFQAHSLNKEAAQLFNLHTQEFEKQDELKPEDKKRISEFKGLLNSKIEEIKKQSKVAYTNAQKFHQQAYNKFKKEFFSLHRPGLYQGAYPTKFDALPLLKEILNDKFEIRGKDFEALRYSENWFKLNPDNYPILHRAASFEKLKNY